MRFGTKGEFVTHLTEQVVCGENVEIRLKYRASNRPGLLTGVKLTPIWRQLNSQGWFYPSSYLFFFFFPLRAASDG